MDDPAADTLSRHPAPSSARLATLADIASVGVALFLSITIVLHLLQPDLDPAGRFVSEYAPGPTGWLMNVAFVALAVALASFAVAFGRQLRPPFRSRAAGILFAVAALGILVSGAFNSDLQTDSVMTTSGAIHDLAGFAAFLTMLPAMVAVAGRLRTHRPEHKLSLSLTVHAWVVIALFVAMLFLFEPRGLVGLGQRLFLATMLGWHLVAAGALRSGMFQRDASIDASVA